MVTTTLEHIHEDLEFLKEKVISIEKELKEIKEPEVREEFVERLRGLEKEKGQGIRFDSKEKFLEFLENEI